VSSDRLLIYAAGFFRAAGVGLLGVIFALALSARGFHTGQIGILIALGLAGSACGTFFATFWADHLGRRKTLFLLTLCIVAGGVGLIFSSSFLGLGILCFFGMVNTYGRERGALSTMEQAILPETADPLHRTQTLAWYNLFLNAGLALGSLVGGLPFFLRSRFGCAPVVSYQAAFFFYMGFCLLNLLLYTRLNPRIEIHGPTPWHKVSPESRRIITRISLLFGLDSLGGGFLPGTLIAYWFFKRFGIGEQTLAPLFFFGHAANALSYLAAAWLSRRIGLIRTMVFTHTPANLCLLALPFAPTLKVAMILFLIRECLIEMDLPTRQSYVMAVVAPSERTIASGVTNLTRLAAWTIAPGFAGFAMSGVGLSFPLFAGGGIKILYDWLLFIDLRHIRPPEEQR